MLNKKYQSVTSAIASYDYKDLAEGIGTFIFYGAIDEGGDGILTGQQVYSSLIESVDTGTPCALDKTFTSTIFNTPNDMSGTCYVTFCVSDTNAAGGPAQFNLTLKLHSGSTETTLMNLSGSSFSPADSLTHTYLFKGVIATTHIKAGDYLTLNIFGAGGDGDAIYLGHDPMDRDGTGLVPSTDSVTTKLMLFAPFKVDVS